MNSERGSRRVTRVTGTKDTGDWLVQGWDRYTLQAISSHWLCWNSPRAKNKNGFHIFKELGKIISVFRDVKVTRYSNFNPHK